MSQASFGRLGLLCDRFLHLGIGETFAKDLDYLEVQ